MCVLALMSSGCEVAQEAVEYLLQGGRKAGMFNPGCVLMVLCSQVRLYCPWSPSHLMDLLPCAPACRYACTAPGPRPTSWQRSPRPSIVSPS